MSDRKAPESPFSLWHGMAADWTGRVARHLLDSAHTNVQESIAFQRELSEARTLSDVAVAQGTAARRMVDTIVEQTTTLSELGASLGKDFVASLTPEPEPGVIAPAE